MSKYYSLKERIEAGIKLGNIRIIISAREFGKSQALFDSMAKIKDRKVIVIRMSRKTFKRKGVLK